MQTRTILPRKKDKVFFHNKKLIEKLQFRKIKEAHLVEIK